MQVNHSKSLKSIIGGMSVFIVPMAFCWMRPAVAQQNPHSTVVLPSAIPGDSRPVMILGGIESVNQVRETKRGVPSDGDRVNPSDDTPVPRPRAEGNASADGPRSGDASAQGPRGGLGGAVQEPGRWPPPRREPPDGQRPRGFGGRNAPQPPTVPGPVISGGPVDRADRPRGQGGSGAVGGPGGPGLQDGPAPTGNPAAPGHWSPPPMMFGSAGIPMDFDQLMRSPVIQKMLALMQENMELKAQIKIQSIESEFKLREREFESKLQDMKRQLEFSQVELKEERISKERMEKRIAELDHRSRLLEERARAIGNQDAQKTNAAELQRLAQALLREFEDKVSRSKHDTDQADAKKSDAKKQEINQEDRSRRNSKDRKADDGSSGKRSYWSDANEKQEKKDSQ